MYSHLIVFPVINGEGRAITSDRIRRFEIANAKTVPHAYWRGLKVDGDCSLAILKSGYREIVAGACGDNTQQLVAWEQEMGL